jgi:pimeloyl-ACP methyl ester carboxylesterase
MPKFFLKIIYNLSHLPSEDTVRLNDKRVFNSIAIYRHLFLSAVKMLHKKIVKLSTPALFLWGKDDAFLNIPTMNEVEKFYERGEIRILQGGHWVMREKPEHVNRILLKTLMRWEQSS